MSIQFLDFYLLELCPIFVDSALCLFTKYNNLKVHIKNPQFFKLTYYLQGCRNHGEGEWGVCAPRFWADK